MSLVSRLVKKTGAVPVFLFAERLSRSKGFHMLWIPAPEGIGDADLVCSASALNRGVEQCVRLCPEQVTEIVWIASYCQTIFACANRAHAPTMPATSQD